MIGKPTVLVAVLTVVRVSSALAGPDDRMTQVVDPTPFESADVVILTGLHRVEGIPASAADSMIPAEERWPHRRHIGVEAPEGAKAGSAAWWDAKFITVEDAETAVMYIGKDYFVQAGFEYPVAPNQERKPWLVFVGPKSAGKPTRCQFVIAPGGIPKDELSKLREVVAIYGKNIYFKADSAEGEEFLMAANYSFQSEGAAADRGRAAGED